MKKTRLIFFVLTMATFITIFIFSNQNGEESGATSRGFTKAIIEALPMTKYLDEGRKIEFIENIQIVVRKLAHFSIYTVLGINLMGFINTYDEVRRNDKILITIFVGVMYAVSDEFHQMFSGGRTPAIGDVCIDSLGVLFGLMIYCVLNTIKLNHAK